MLRRIDSFEATDNLLMQRLPPRSSGYDEKELFLD